MSGKASKPKPAEPQPLPSSGGSYAVEKGKLKQTEAPAKPPLPGQKTVPNKEA